MNDQTTVKQPSKKPRAPRRVKDLVLFISDCWYFAKRWKPIRISFCPRHKTVFLWRIATKRREAKAAFLEKKKQNRAIDGKNSVLSDIKGVKVKNENK